MRPHDPVGATVNAENLFDHDILLARDDIYQYGDYRAQSDEFSFPNLLSDWEADINSIIDIM